MRIISGKARGTKLETVEGLKTRPTADRVKEAMFNLIQFDIQGGKVLDLFSGSGALGLEAASRGAEFVYLIEKNNECHKVIIRNIEKMKMEDSVKLIKSDVFVGMSRLNEKFDIIILDPPYGKDLVVEVIKHIENSGILSDKGLIVAEHSVDDIIPETLGKFSIFKQKKYGKIMVSIFSYDN